MNIYLVLAALLVLTACAPGSLPATPAGPSKTEPADVGGIAFTTVARGAALGTEPAKPVYAAAADAARWNDLRSQLPDAAFQAGVPVAQRGDALVVVAYAGVKRTGGYGIAVQSIERQGSELAVVVAETAPRPGDMVAQALTMPYHVVAVPKATLVSGALSRIVFRDSQGQAIGQQDLRF